MNYLRRKLGGKPIAEVDLRELFTPDAVVVENGLTRSFSDLPTHVFYYVESPELIVFESEAQVGGTDGMAMLEQVMDFAQELKVTRIYTAAAQAMAAGHAEPVRVLAAANVASLRDELSPAGLEILQEGLISGLNGLLLGAAGLRGVEAACLLATMPMYAQMMPNPKASRQILQVLERLLGISVDMAEIDEAVSQMDRTMADVEAKIRATFSEMERGEGEPPEFEAVAEEEVPQVVMEKIERLFDEVQRERSRDKAEQLKRELDKWNLYRLYEDRFLGLFRQGPSEGT
jgi:predicted ATP-grasp superfamily ATP-dependent carboligase